MSADDSYQSSFILIEREGDFPIAVIQRPQLSEEDNLEEFGFDLANLVDKLNMKTLVLDLSRVKYITSAAIGRLIAFHRKLNRDKGTLVLCHVEGTVRDILSASQLLSYFHVADGREAAISQLA